MNVLDDLQHLIGADYEVVMGTRKAPGATGVYVALEHLSLGEPQEFYAITLLDAIRQAAFWFESRPDGEPRAPDPGGEEDAGGEAGKQAREHEGTPG